MGQGSSKHRGNDQHAPLFVSLGSYELQTIDYERRDIHVNEPGGGGLWATFGARLFLSGDKSKDVGCLLVAGSDFPRHLYTTLTSWNMTVMSRYMTQAECTRAYIQYTAENDFRKRYNYLTPLIETEVLYMDFTALLNTKSFHILGSPQDLRQKVAAILELREKHGIEGRPKIIWEPAAVADQTPESFDEHLSALELVDVFSPNYHDVGFCLGPNIRPDKAWVVEHAQEFLGRIGPGRDGVLVVRCGRWGCYYVKTATEKGWVDAYWDYRRSQVLDQTGAGSAFVGAYMVAAMQGKSVKESCIRATVAAGFAVEQYGLPTMTLQKRARRSPWRPLAGGEAWNDDDPGYRVKVLQVRMQMKELGDI